MPFNSRFMIILFILFSLVSAIVYFKTSTPSNNLASVTESNAFQLVESKLNQEAIQPIPEESTTNPTKVLIGEKLFHDPNLSSDGTISCASCHDLNKGGTDQRKLSIGVNNRKGSINTPTVFNAVFNFKQFWDGRASDLKTQAVGPLFAHHEMGNTNWNSILSYLNNSKEYRLMFKELYPHPITQESFLDALSEFGKSLTTPNSRFDKYLKGDSFALNTLELEGYQLFKNQGCISCHQGINMGGNMFQKAGIFEAISEGELGSWEGRFTITQNENDKGLFKVPTLRNIALTAPYFHDGTAETLEDSVTVMGRAQLGTELTTEEVNKIVAFLKTLTGEYKQQPL
ncbi:cytochrome-c peroxidase [Thiomicrorhabdus sp. Kp2]|uniref:cytochrome-c peroxidase n=1 Tax=Thiomicrorhabdus sp. Kp2 TaxID=1123518 RepID=UPI00040AE4C8|nr:cytochrome-c peroxidase [Thiomicrorhabdus sp. Kp2]